MGKIYVILGEFYDSTCDCWVSNLFHGAYSTLEEADRMKETMVKYNQENSFDYYLEVREVEVY